MVEQKVADYSTPYQFNGKELDAETGLYNYGARFYDPKLSLWLGVDPLADKYPNMSPYGYVGNSPTNAEDPDGRIIIINGSKGYQEKVYAAIMKMLLSGDAGGELVMSLISSSKEFFIADTESHIPNMVTGGNVMFFDLGQANSDSEPFNGRDDGPMKNTTASSLAHELDHFIDDKFSPNDKFINDEGYSYTEVGVSEPRAVETENKVRGDLGMKLRHNYGGLNVFGKEPRQSGKRVLDLDF